MAISSRVTKQISSPLTKRNPRPRKYASQAERQAAYRARNVMLEFRAEPKTADNVSKIADTLGYPRSDVLLSMVKFALTNHDWARFGLTHKTIPTYKGNPIMKPASPAQLAARARFAEMARSGAFKKKATKRKANPSTYDPYAPRDHLAEYRTKTDAQLRHIMQDAGEAAKAMRGHSPRAEEKYLDQINDAATILWERKQKASKRKINPAKKTVSQKISQLRHEGYPQRQAVAVALSEQRAGKVKRNPMHQYTVLHRGTANVAGQVIASGPQAAKQKVAEKLGIPTLAYLIAKKTNPANVKHVIEYKGHKDFTGYAVREPGSTKYIAVFASRKQAVALAQNQADLHNKTMEVAKIQLVRTK